jgi:hypothetical protein
MRQKATVVFGPVGQMFNFDAQYPPNVRDVLDSKMTFNPSTLRAVRAFKRCHPWRGTHIERQEKFRGVVITLAEAYGISPPKMDFSGVDENKDSGSSHYIPAFHAIYFCGRLSVVTMLHEFAHALGKGEWEASRWSINLYRRIWPKQFARLHADGHMLRRP